MTPTFILQNRNVYLRVDHALVGATIAAKHARRTDRTGLGEFRVLHSGGVEVVGERAGR